MTLFDGDCAGWIQVLLEFIAIALVVVFYARDYRGGRKRAEEERGKEQDKKRSLKRAILSAVKREVEMDWRYLRMAPLPEVPHKQYYDPARQVFKVCRDDAVMQALTVIESDVLLHPELAESLVAVSQAVRWVNQQVDELTLFRFGSPSLLSMAGAFAEANPGTLAEVASDEGKIQSRIPINLRAWFKELARRNRAIVDIGYWKRLLPTLVVVRPRLDKVLQEMGLQPLDMPKLDEVLDRLAVEAARAASTSDSPSVGSDEAVGGTTEETKDERGMTYHVYENWVARKAKVHFSNCRFCNSGEGIHPASGSGNGRWLGPFASLDEVLQAAHATGEPVTKCKFCRPQ